MKFCTRWRFVRVQSFVLQMKLCTRKELHLQNYFGHITEHHLQNDFELMITYKIQLQNDFDQMHC